MVKNHGAVLVVVAAGAVLAFAPPAAAQGLSATDSQRLARSAVEPQGADAASAFGRGMANAEAGALLVEIRALVEESLAASRAAEHGRTVAEVRAGAERVFSSVWGKSSGLLQDGSSADAAYPGWKERWQVSGAEFDTSFVARYGSRPPLTVDPRELGIVGRSRAVVGRLVEIAAAGSPAGSEERAAAEAAVAALNNVIGWSYITVGFKGRERQPRISLTHLWDAPPSFWNSTAVTGWLFEAQAQASNILKTAYGDEVDEAGSHAAEMTRILERVLNGVDVNGDGVVRAAAMEGGVAVALEEAARAGLRGHPRGTE
jgi:hypothetical protein